MLSKYFFRSPFRVPDEVSKHTQNLHELERAFNEHIHEQGTGWLSYTPALTSSGTQPTMGTNSTAYGKYYQYDTMVVCQVAITFGTASAAAGTGTYSVSLPVTAFTQPKNAWRAGNASLYDQSAGFVASPYVYVDTSSTVRMEYPGAWPTGAFNAVGATTPWTWANNDELRLWFIYQAA